MTASRTCSAVPAARERSDPLYALLRVPARHPLARVDVREAEAAVRVAADFAAAVERNSYEAGRVSPVSRGA